MTHIRPPQGAGRAPVAFCFQRHKRSAAITARRRFLPWLRSSPRSCRQAHYATGPRRGHPRDRLHGALIHALESD